MNGKLPALQLPFLLFFHSNIFLCLPLIVFNLTFFEDISFYPENSFYLFSQLFFNTTKICMDYFISDKLT